MRSVPTRRKGTMGDRVCTALEEFPGGAQSYVVQEEMGITSPIDRKRVTAELARLAREGRLHRFGEPGAYFYQLPESYLHAQGRPGQPRLTPDHPTITAAREAARYLRPDLACRLNQLADWATGEPTA